MNIFLVVFLCMCKQSLKHDKLLQRKQGLVAWSVHVLQQSGLNSRRYRFVNRWRVLLGSIYNKPVNANVAEVKTIVYHSSYLPFVDPNIDDNSRDIAVLALTHPLTFNGRTHVHILEPTYSILYSELP